MERSRIDSVALLGAALAAALVLLVARSDFGFLTTVGGLTLLLILFAYDQEGRRSIFQSLAFSAVCGFCFMLMTGIVFEFSLNQSNAGLSGSARDAYFQVRLAVTWAFTTLLFWAIDRARMSGRTTYEIPSTAPPQRTSVQRQFVPEFTGPLQTPATPAPAPAPAVTPTWAAPAAPLATATPSWNAAPPPPPPPAPAWATAPTPTPAAAPPWAAAPSPTPAPAPAWAAAPAPVATLPVAAPPPPPAAQQPQYYAQPAEYYAPSPATIITAPPPAASVSPAPEPAPPPVIPVPAPAPVPAPPAAPPVRLPTGREVMIYVNLVGEGLNVLRSVRAEHLGRDFYRIIEDTPEGETWEYTAGQVVRRKKKNLSSGKALVAFEEAPRSQ